jgi:thiol-disulfide isomerase/thioredoxin
VTEANAMVIAAVFNSEKNQGYANPPSSKPFWAYYTDASAAAIPGHTGYNTVNPAMAFTHTVFVEEGTATWCPYCPAMANTLNAIYESGDYPFYFVALVDDMNSQAASRLRSEYNIYGFPTGFFDGGYQLLLGGYDLESYYRPLIEACGQREVPTLNLSVSVTYIGNGDLQIGVNITNNNLPPTIPQAPSGNTNGNVGTEYIYTTTTTDPNNDKVRYWFDWDDGTNSGWIGPYPSGVIVNATHTWKTKGTYNIKVKAVDPSNSESNWSNSLPITMPYSYNPLLQFLELLFQRFPHAFPILRQLLGY